MISVASLFVFRKRPEWQRLRAVSFCYPLIPAAYILVGTSMILYGVVWQPKASAGAAITIALGAVVYRFGIRPRNRAAQ